MFYLTVDNLICAVDDLNKNDMEGATDVMKQAIVRAEKLDPDKEDYLSYKMKRNVFGTLQN